MAKDKVDRVTGEILGCNAGVPYVDRFVDFVRPQLRASYDDHKPMSDASGLRCEDESLASQSSLEESDINVLVRRFGLTGALPTNLRAPWYGDFADLKSPHEMAQALVQAQAAFMAMPASVRADFDNDPHRFVDFCSKDENYDRMCDLGLLAPEPMRKRVEARQAKERADLEAKVQAEVAKREKASKAAGHS